MGNALIPLVDILFSDPESPIGFYLLTVTLKTKQNFLKSVFFKDREVFKVLKWELRKMMLLSSSFYLKEKPNFNKSQMENMDSLVILINLSLNVYQLFPLAHSHT